MNNMDFLWMLICGTMIFFMQAGFTCFEVGSIQSKNIISVSIENLVTFMITSLLFCAAGFGIMFGKSFAFAGGSFFFLSGLDEYGLFGYSFVFMQIMFAAVGITIFGGAMSERTRTPALFVAAGVAALLIYPVYGHWVWGGMLTGDDGWLAALGYLDFAGASVVHMTGGMIALAGILIVGKRKTTENYRSNVPFAVLGVFILWFGWLGFNGGSCLGLDAKTGLVLLNTTIGAAAGMAGALVYHAIFIRRGNYLIAVFDGVLGGLVAITACSYYVQPAGAAMLTFITGFAVMASHYLLKKLGIDDAVDAVPVHAAGGICGLLLLPFFAESEYISGSRSAQFAVQLLGVSVNIVWVFGLSYIMFKIINRVMGMRVSGQSEEQGLNISEFDDIYSWEKHQEISSYETSISDKNRLLRKQARLLTVTEEQEKDNIRRELHDGVGQSLAALKLTLGVAEKKASAGSSDSSLISKAVGMTDETIAEMRAVLNSLNPPKLSEGLVNALNALADAMNQTGKVRCEVEVKSELPAFDETFSLNIYRLAQEAVSNAVKHGKASDIEIILSLGHADPEGKEIFRMDVTDNGSGFDVKAATRGMGLSNMTDRAQMLGGRLEICSSDGEGTRITAYVPSDYQV